MAVGDGGSDQFAKDAEVIAALQKHGDKLSRARKITHWAYFKSADAATRFAAQAEDLDLIIDDMRQQGARFAVRLTHVAVPTQPAISQLTCRLASLVTEHGGEYDGWETVVVRDLH